jgi:cytochrome P450
MAQTENELAGDEGPAITRYDGYDPATAQDYFEVVASARQTCPVAHSETHGGYWIATRHDDIRQVLSDPDTFSNSRGIMIPVEDRLRKPPQDVDPPLQTEFRRLLNRYFSRHGLARHAEQLHRLAHDHVAAILPRGDRARGGLGGGPGCDVIQDFAKPLTAAVLSSVILDLRDPARFTEMRRFVEAIAHGSAEDSSRAFRQLQAAVDDLLVALAGREERDDVIDAVLRGTVQGRPLTRDERVGTIMQLLLGGLKTTVAAIGHIVACMAQTEGLEARLREPDWARDYLDEFLRLEPPVKMVARAATRDVVLGGHQIRAGEMVAVMIGSANRDDAVFEGADELRLGRRNNPHLSFGLGVHRCIGSNLARLEIVSAITALLAKAENIRLVPGTVLARTPSAPELSWEAVPIDFDLIRGA